MPGDERSTRGDRCSVHPSQPEVARCDVCGRPMCLACAVPVRGVAVGHECLAVALGDDAPPPEAPERPPIDVTRWATLLGALTAVVASLLPWSRFGTGSETLGAWGDTFRWSLVSAVAAVLTLAMTLVPRRRRSVDAAVLIAAAAIVAASVLAIVDPPAFTSPWLGPWVAIAGGALGVLAAAIGLVTGSIRRRPRV